MYISDQILNSGFPQIRYRVRPEKRRDSWAGSMSSISGTPNNRSSESGVGGCSVVNRTGEGRTLVAATAPITLSRTDLAIQVNFSIFSRMNGSFLILFIVQAAVGRAVIESNTPGTYSLGHMGAGTAIAAAASQAIVATQQVSVESI